MRATIYLRIYISRHTVWVTVRSLILIDLTKEFELVAVEILKEIYLRFSIIM